MTSEELDIRLRNIERKIEQMQGDLYTFGKYAILAAKDTLNMNEVSWLTGLSKSHLYKLTSTKQIPHYKPNTKAMYFDKAEIEAWMKQNRVNTQAEAEQQASKYIVEKLIEK